MPKCSHCQQEGHNRASKNCPRYGQDPVPEAIIEKEPPANRWTTEKEVQLVELWKSAPLKVDWVAISDLLGLSLEGCKSRLNKFISHEDQVDYNISKLTYDDIRKALDDRKNVCGSCGDIYYHELREWRGIKECCNCLLVHTDEINRMWLEIDQRMDAIGWDRCSLCERPRLVGTKFHFDHLNMFDKSHNICDMVNSGQDIETIWPECLKCQVICKSCHEVITHIENLTGFSQAKSNLTRLLNKGVINEQELLQKQLELSDKYRQSFQSIYSQMKSIIQHSKNPKVIHEL